MNRNAEASSPALLAVAGDYDPFEVRLRENVRGTIDAMFEEELAEYIGRCRYGRGEGSKKAIATGIATASSSARLARKR